VENSGFKEANEMKRENRFEAVLPVESEGARRATGDSAGGAAAVGPLGPGQRWSPGRKREIVLRLLRGESTEALSRELGVEQYRLAKWKDRALGSIEASLRERGSDPLQIELDEALKRIGELSMENELLRVRCKAASPLAWRGSRR
jgi:transposase-like protein